MLPIRIEEIPREIQEYVNKINSISFPRQGHSSNVGLIENNQEIYALKRTMGELNCALLNREVTVLNCLTQKTKLPIPKVKSFVEQVSEKESWALIEFLEGETVRAALYNEKSKGKRHEIIYNFGNILRQIHSTPCPSELISERPWLDEKLCQAELNFKKYHVGCTLELLGKIKSFKPKECPQTLIHGDFTIDNVLVKNGVITGVIDWGGGAYGDPRYDVSLAIRPKPNAFEDEIDKQIFFEGYGGKIIDDNEYDYFVNGLYEFF
ncbi:aminoglycoside phosphotransferase APH(3') [Solibacillus sp. FSL W7-1472]|uniref:Predicted aminoglycoside phosphotransferase n=1 Tax=Solibacillus silvestris (strain StLB046) TaxID=1002809 RepID=F2F9F2_SOLSS|nr:aminoglycoside phosphotransferase APH(3') [Solibacillus silvestris]BAK16679.1 predicted aminoglycoside phosphotransferase [Solibacillus silvestris StLB046]